MASHYKTSIYPDGVAVISYAGVLDKDVIGRSLKECYERNCYNIVIDLGNTDHAGSSALAVFEEARNTLTYMNGNFVFVRVDGPLQIILDMMGVPEKFAFYDSLNEALQDLISTRTTRKFSL